MLEVQIFSQGKVKESNEDCFGYNKSCFVLADGATDKSGKLYDGKSGGEIVSRLVVKEALASELAGVELVDFLNKKVYQLYKDLEITNDIVDPKNRFSCACLAARIIKDKIVITNVGDSGFRINGEEINQQIMLIDKDNSEIRAKYIEKTGDIAGSREYIAPFLLKQFPYQNNPDHALGYGVIDGTPTPEKFIKTFTYPKGEIKILELFSDGYFSIPAGVNIQAWENEHEKVEREDPDKWKKYKSTKSKDDRTIAIIKF